MPHILRHLLVLGFFMAAPAWPCFAQSRPADDPRGKPVRRPMKAYQTRYYVIHTDLGEDEAREAQMRTTAIAKEYYQQTKNFVTGRVVPRMPLYLYSRAEDYYAAGAPPGSGGCFNGHKLMAIMATPPTEQNWQVVQHEGFHQFAEGLISRKIPIWMEEGLADYFGDGLFTGDGFVTGIIMPHQRQMVQSLIKAGKHRPLEQMMKLTNAQWGGELLFANYLQGWSMVHFLIHGDDGRYRKSLDQFLMAMSRGKDWKTAWKAEFGTNIANFEKRWSEWWLAVPRNATWDLFAKAMVATATSFFARATAQKQMFTSADDFFRHAKAGTLKSAQADWLPPRLMTSRLYAMQFYGRWSIVQTDGGQPRLRCSLRMGGQMTGSFKLNAAGLVESVDVEVELPATRPADSQDDE